MNAEPAARSLDALLAAPVLVAGFHAGSTALGHHWTVADGTGRELLRTKRTHSGGAVSRTLWKSVTLTGLDAGNDIHADLVGAGDTVLARASSVNKKPFTVTVTDASKVDLGGMRRDGAKLTLEAGGRIVATVDTEGDGPWAVLGPDGTQLAELLAGAPGPSTTAGWDELLFPVAPTNSADFARTMHLGIRRVTRYTLARLGPGGEPVDPARAGPLPRLVGLLPLLAGLAY